MKRSLGLVLLLMCSAAGAQVQVEHAADGNSFQRLVSISVPSVPGAPFTLTLSTQWIRTLADGSTITLINHRLIARDNAGRVFQERRYLVPVSDPNADRITNLQWNDPVKHEFYNCLTATLVCQVSRDFSISGETIAQPGPTQDGKAFIAVEALGTRTIAGVETDGSRETTTIKAGAIGNDKPIVITKEFWYSPELKLNLMVERNDPRSGRQTFTVTNLKTGDQKHSLFDMPSGFRLVDHRKMSVSGGP
jgi:hypothetical protein